MQLFPPYNDEQAWKIQAKRWGMPLTRWMIWMLNRAADRNEEPYRGAQEDPDIEDNWDIGIPIVDERINS
jgi:hypothetical protein